MVSAGWRKAAATATPLAASSAIAGLVLGPTLPIPLQAVIGWGGLGLMAVLMTGRCELLAVRILHRARPMDDLERTTFAPVLAGLCARQLGPPAVEYLVAIGRNRPAAIARGRRTVVVSRELVDGVTFGRVPAREATAVLAHAALVCRAGHSRQDVAIAYWTVPWRMLRTFARPARGIVGFAWSCRPVIITVASVQTVREADGLWRIVLVASLAALLALSYTVPRWTRRWETWVVDQADAAIVDHQLGADLAAFLRRYPPNRRLVSRQIVLESPRPAALRLVTT